MATIKYLLKKSKINKEGKAPLYIAIYHMDQTEMISTKEFIKPALWDAKNQRVRSMKNLPEDATHIDVVLGKIRQSVVKVQNRLKTDLEIDPTATQIKEAWELDQKGKKDDQRQKESKKKEDEFSITKKIDSWIGNLTYRPLTTKAITNSLKKFKEFLVLSNISEVKGITKEAVDAYGKWLFEKKKLANASHGRHMKHLRWFLKTLNPGFEIKDIKIHAFKKPIIALTWEELKKLEAVDVSYSVELQKSKDLFLLGCYTGLRISDLKRITKSSIRNNEIHLRLLKNAKDVEIPILPETKAILERYGYRGPKIAEQTLNSSIKTVCDKAGINENFNYTYTKANKKIDTDIPKHKLISSHTSGKTFISLAGQRWGLAPAEIAAIVGKDVRTILSYYFKNDNKTAKEKMLSKMNASMKVVA